MIERATESRCNSSTFVVPKSNPGEFRLVSDLREVNKVLEKDFVQARPLNQIFSVNQATNPKHFSTLDVKSAFFSKNYKEGSSDPTSFYADCGTYVKPFTGESDTGKYRYKKLVMEAQTSSAALERAMEMTLAGIPGVKVYADDVIIYSSSKEQHLDRVKRVFEGAAKFGIKFAPEKIRLCHKSLT